MKKKIIGSVVFISLLISSQGYCLFRDDIGAQQVQSAIKIQRAKDEQRKKQTEQVKKQEIIKEEAEAEGKDMTYSSQSPERKAKKENFTQALNPEKSKPVLQYKRHTPQGIIIDTASPTITPTNIIIEKKEKKRSNNGLVLLILVLGIAGFIIFKKRQNE